MRRIEIGRRLFKYFPLSCVPFGILNHLKIATEARVVTNDHTRTFVDITIGVLVCVAVPFDRINDLSLTGIIFIDSSETDLGIRNSLYFRFLIRPGERWRTRSLVNDGFLSKGNLGLFIDKDIQTDCN